MINRDNLSKLLYRWKFDKNADKKIMNDLLDELSSYIDKKIEFSLSTYHPPQHEHIENMRF